MKMIISTSLLLCLLFPQQVFSQEKKEIKRKGIVFGMSNGIGYSLLKFPDKNQRDLGYALDLKLGYMVKPGLALLITSNVSVYNYSGYGRDRKRDFGILAPSAQYWISDKFWVLGGVGLGGDNPVFWDIKNPDEDPLETRYYFGTGVVSAVGYEIYQNKNFIIDLNTKITYRNVNMQEGKTNGVSYAFLVGINFN